jgi:hypothetical protein
MTYRELISDPRCVCNDWFYSFMHRFPGHPAIWAVLFGVALPLITALLSDIGAPINHVRSATELHANYFFGPVIVLQVVVMPLLYQAALECFDHLRRAMPVDDAVVSGLRQAIIVPTEKSQRRLLGSAVLFTLVIQEKSSSRLSRFVTGDWNGLDVWLTASALISFVMFLWYLILPLGRTAILARMIDKYIQPELFDESLGRPIGAYGLRAGLIFAIPYAIVVGASVAVVSETWAYVVPAVIGVVVALAFALIPGQSLQRRTRQVKKAELAWLKTAITECRRKVNGGVIDNEQLSKLVNLADYRQQVLDLREWPFEAKFIRGFGLYFLLIPLTWVASAVVELVIEQLAMAG